MKIGILTLPPNNNYGGILQGWALQTILKEFGHEVDLFIYSPLVKHNLKSELYRIKHSISKLVRNFLHYKNNKNTTNHLERFVREKINTKSISNLQEINNLDYDAIVVGSDQIWRQIMFSGLWKCVDHTYPFLSFITKPSVIRIAYAASLGLNMWTFDPMMREKIHCELEKFSGVSVREVSAIEIMQEAVGVKPEFVLDPTMLLSDDHYIKLTEGIPYSHEKKIISYILDANSDTQEIINAVQQSTNLKCKELNLRSPHKIPIEEWIAEIASAKLVITDSFHGCVFSIIFRKPLIIIGNENRGNARFDSLIHVFGLQKNLVPSVNHYNMNNNYCLPDDIDSRICDLREQSISFLMKSLA